MSRHRCRRTLAGLLTAALAALATWAGPASTARADTSPGPPVAGLSCPPEQYPHAGSPRSAASTPYEIPFTATLGQKDPAGLPIGGYLQIANSLVTATLGGPVLTDPTTGQSYGEIYAKLCGLVSLPSQAGTIASYGGYGTGADPRGNHDFVFTNPIPVSIAITGVPGVPVLQAYGEADGELTAQIDPTPAANGGLNVEFYGAAKSTSNFGPALSALAQLLGGSSSVTLPGPVQSLLQGVSNNTGNACTVAIGNEIEDGVPAADVQAGATGLSYAQATAAVHFTTRTSGKLHGLPVTGPITGSNATLVSNDFVVGKIDPNTIPAPGDPGAVCSSSNASLLNSLLGLPSIPNPATGSYPNSFYAPGTFAVYTSS